MVQFKKTVEDMTWNEFEILVVKVGAPWPDEKKKRLGKKSKKLD